ncbi:HpcH/HpaI aldolase family protein [Paracoccus aestuariivivens]|uniref:2,4-dihydroxyhept-2-ene-1,7-dioic acid aldolase n=1 Tax=Paracoccus aestuariivivens TaxID=1820333 RepID=A0A6L6JB67_9RHOB|nr:aldolase/citrate lyase family protein [Paracoccus aestuariivivens]MTH79230.1 2,4-dihydroxyhept-2-ene-1,7-dioic acid aldolase [Paracoccus aestuariivivens]
MSNLRDKLGRPTFGMNVYSGAPAVVEIAGKWGLDFVFIDAEHTALGLDLPMERMILAARLAGVSPLVRVPDSDPVGLRKALELGAEGVIIPQVHNAAQMRAIVQATKFPPLGRRGGDSSVRSAGYGGPDFDWAAYAEQSNRETLLVPMAESPEFFAEIDAILDVPGIDAVHFGPADYALSCGIPVDYSMRHPQVRSAMRQLVEKCHARNIRVMLPCFPADPAQVAELLAEGGDMLLVGNDMAFLHQGCRNAAMLAAQVRGGQE